MRHLWAHYCRAAVTGTDASNLQPSLDPSKDAEIITRTFVHLYSSYHTRCGVPLLEWGRKRRDNDGKTRITIKKRGKKRRFCMIKQLTTKALQQHATKTPSFSNPPIECMGTMWFCMHPLLQTPLWWLMKLTQGFQLFMTWGLHYLLGWCKQANCISSYQTL